MHLKHRFFAAAAVAVMTVGIIYGSQQEIRQETEETSNINWIDNEDTIYFWYTNERMTNFVNSAAVSFGEREKVHVIPVLAPNSEYLKALNEASIREEKLPDVYLISHDNLEKAYLAGLAAEIDDVGNICTEENFPAAALSAVEYKGKKVAYPLSFETSALVYNVDYLREWARQTALNELTQTGEDDDSAVNPEDVAVDEAVLAARTEEIFQRAIPYTVSDILTIADTFDLPEGVEVMKWDVSDIFYNYWIVGNYMEVGGDAGDDATRISINNQNTIRCLETYQALNQFFFIEADKTNYESVMQDFMDGKIVFTIATTDVVERLKTATEEGTLGFEYGISMMPAVSDELESRSMSVTNTVAVNGYSRKKDLANRFAAYLVGECADSLYEKTGKVSTNLNAESDNGALQIFKLEYAGSVPLPKMKETGNYWLILERLFAKVWNGADVTAYVQELNLLITSQTNEL